MPKALVLLSVLLLLGCQSTVAPRSAPPAPVAASRPTPARPYLLHLPGIGGKRSIDQSLVRGLVEGGFKGDVDTYDWTGGNVGIQALHGFARNHEQAKVIARKIIARRRANPAGSIYLTCHSGGAGLAVWALEDLPPDIHIQGLIFMAPALSPGYDLTAALHHVDGRAYAFTSLSDSMVLGYGTRMFGTIDGVNTDAAGRVGFRRPPQADAAQYAKLTNIPYDPDWSQYHNLGDHVGAMSRLFSRQVITPVLLWGIVPPLPATLPTTLPDTPVHPH